VVLRLQCCGGGEHDHTHGHGSDDDDDDDDDEEVEEHPLDSLAGLLMPADHVQALAKLLGFHGEAQVREKRTLSSNLKLASLMGPCVSTWGCSSHYPLSQIRAVCDSTYRPYDKKKEKG
jgi:hypothetical protein